MPPLRVLDRKGFTKAIKKRVLTRDGNACRYCGDIATTVDHIVPVSFIPIHQENNLVAACGRCNNKLGNRMFTSLDEKREFLLQNLKSRKRTVPLWIKSEIKELGHVLASSILDGCLVVSTEEERKHVAHYLEKMGLIPVLEYRK